MIIAVILAAGRSIRMGQPKMLLPWGETTVLGQVIETVRRAGVEEIVVVTGGAREAVERLAASYQARTAFNEDFESGEMLSSLQTGLMEARKNPSAAGALIVLGDQPQVEERSVRAVASRFKAGRVRLVVPSYRMRRGHPWLAARPLWEEILQMRPPETPRDFLNRHADEIEYVEAGTPSIFADLDTPEDYLQSKP